MEKFSTLTAIAAPLPIDNLDTDQLMPKQFLRGIDKSGLAKGLLYHLRFDENGQLRPDFVLNKKGFEQTHFIVAGPNFGCGSSREHAPWALLDFGIRAIIASSFADIFSNNALGNGLLLVKLTPEEVEEIHQALNQKPGMEITIDLEENTVTVGSKQYTFTVDPFRRECILKGLDTIALTLAYEADIQAYEATIPAWRKLNR